MSSPEAVAIVCEVIRQVTRGEHPGVPSPHVIRLSASGTVSIEGPVEAGGKPVPRSAQLLESLLPRFDAPAEMRAPGALRLVVARALGTLDLPPYPSLDSFAEAVRRFAAPDPSKAVQDVVARWAAAPAVVPGGGDASSIRTSSTPDQTDSVRTRAADFRRSDRHDESAALVRLDPALLTVSDVRRARRATGLSLSDISERSRIPVPMLRQLEWGYLYRWPGGLYGRTQLVRYARAAGLDEALVVATLSPLLDEMGERVLPAQAFVDAPPEPVPHDVREITIVDAEPFEPEFADESDQGRAPQPAAASDVDRHLADTAIAMPFSEAEIVIDEPLLFRETISPPKRARVVPAMAAAAAIVAAAGAGYWSQIQRRPTSPPPLTATAEPRTEPAGSADTKTPQSPAVSVAAPDRAESSAAASPSPKSVPPETAATTSPADDKQPRALMDAESVSPSFASVGSAVFFQPDDAADAGVVRIGSTSPGEVLRITRVVDDNARNFHARPSPDGTQVAFDSDRDGERAVYVADADGQNVRRVSGEGFAAIPSWSPDGRSLAFLRGEIDRPRVWNLWVVDLPSGDVRRLTSNDQGQSSGASWFPGGNRIAYGVGERLVVLDVTTGVERSYTSPRPGKAVRSPAVSPDGRRVMFQVEHDGAWLLDVTDGSMLKVLSDPSADNYSWSRDGRRVAYQSQRSGEWGVWVMAAR